MRSDIERLKDIAEAVAAIEKHTEIPWSKVVGMRNILVHNYFGIDFDVV
jgi:uncharacterized protein with HEPN domain